jgi:flagellar biosynthesis/type III secretory pathway protein FliH
VKAEEPAADRFSLASRYLEVLWKDDAFREQWEDVIERRLQERYVAENTAVREKVLADARAEGLAEGIRQGQARIEEACTELHTFSRRILNEKEALLHSHERQWCDTMLHLLKRFMIPRPEEFISVLQAWLEDSMRGFSQKSKVRIYLGETDFERLNEVLAFRVNAQSLPYDFGTDRGLAPGEVRCEFEGGGAFFSPSQELGELEAYLDGMFANQEAAQVPGKV